MRPAAPASHRPQPHMQRGYTIFCVPNVAASLDFGDRAFGLLVELCTPMVG